jgi:hypothetical protein
MRPVKAIRLILSKKSGQRSIKNKELTPALHFPAIREPGVEIHLIATGRPNI